MAFSVKHAFVSPKGDPTDTTLVRPSNWNAEHKLTAGANTVLGVGDVPGNVAELTFTPFARKLAEAADANSFAEAVGNMVTTEKLETAISEGLEEALADTVLLDSPNIFTEKQSFDSWIQINCAQEVVEEIATAPTGIIQLNVLSGGIKYFPATATANFIFNIRAAADATLASVMPNNRKMTCIAEVMCGATARVLTGVTIDGADPSTIRWRGGPPTPGANAKNFYLITVHRKNNGLFEVDVSLAVFE
jgi:hypothetical protein